MSNRLTRIDRDAIEIALLSRALEADKAELRSRETEAFLAVRHQAYDAETLVLLSKLPPGFVPETMRLEFDGEEINAVSPMRFRADDVRHYRDTATFGKDIGEVPAVDVYKHASKSFDKKKARLKSSIRGVLQSVTTWKKLFEIWPEARDVLAPLATDTTTNLPAVIPQTLNTELRLP